MRAYIAIVVDAFREALSSRILWIALGLVAILLMALAPLGYRTVYTTAFTGDDIYSRQQLLKLLADGKSGNAGTRRVAAALPSAQLDRAKAAHGGSDQPPGRGEIAEWLTKLLDDPSKWYDADAWKDLRSSKEQRDLEAMPAGELSEEQGRRLSRLRIESALPGAVAARSNRSIRITYAVWDFPRDLPLTPRDFERVLNAVILPLIMNLLLGFGGVLVAILVTSPVVPQLFLSGSLPLLLSKPIRRMPLLVSVMIGATSFILVCVTPLIVGLFLIAGFRFDLWNPRLLLCIPLFLLMFLVYYSVSAFAALVWRNAIVSVAVTAIFWFVCFVIQTAETIATGFIEGPIRIERVTQDRDRLLAATLPGRIVMWDQATGQWKTILDTSLFDQRWLLGPKVLPEGGAVAAQGRPPIGGAGRMLYLPADQDDTEATWPLPPGCNNLAVDSDGSVIAQTVTGPFRLPPNLVKQTNVDEQDAEPLQRIMGWFGAVNKSEAFKPVVPKGIDLYAPVSQTLTGDGHTIVYSRGELYRLVNRTPAADAPVAHVSVGGAADDASGKLAVVGPRLALAREESPLLLFDRETLAAAGEIDLKEYGEVRELAGEPDGGRLLVLTSRRELYLLNPGDTQLSKAPLRRDVQTVSWVGPNELLLVHSGDSVDAIKLDGDQMQVTSRYRPRLSGWRMIHRYLIKPIATIMPQPSKLGATVQATILGDDQITIGEPRDREMNEVMLNPWQPLVNCIAFVIVMVGVGCLYFYRLDF